jgi:hypothetical protein
MHNPAASSDPQSLSFIILPCLDTSIMAEDIITTTESLEEWKPQLEEWLVMITLALISLMAALDATILVPLIPV